MRRAPQTANPPNCGTVRAMGCGLQGVPFLEKQLCKKHPNNVVELSTPNIYGILPCPYSSEYFQVSCVPTAQSGWRVNRKRDQWNDCGMSAFHTEYFET